MTNQQPFRPGILFFLVLTAILTACKPNAGNAQAPAGAALAATLLYAEHKTLQHPTKNVYVNIWPNGPQVTFHNLYGNMATYEFPSEAFPLHEPCLLLSPGSPDFLPLRVVRIGPNDYRIEWLEAAPTPGSLRVVSSH